MRMLRCSTAMASLRREGGWEGDKEDRKGAEREERRKGRKERGRERGRKGRKGEGGKYKYAVKQQKDEENK